MELMDTYCLKRPSSPMCTCCYGSGEQLGGGCIKETCRKCDGTGVINLPVIESEKEFKLDKRSKEYKNAIRELMDLGMSKENAERELSKGL